MDAYTATKSATEAAIKKLGSQSAVALALGVSNATVSYWKLGEQIASLENYLALLDLGERAPARKGAARILGSVLAALTAASALTFISPKDAAAYTANPLISKTKSDRQPIHCALICNIVEKLCRWLGIGRETRMQARYV